MRIGKTREKINNPRASVHASPLENTLKTVGYSHSGSLCKSSKDEDSMHGVGHLVGRSHPGCMV